MLVSQMQGLGLRVSGRALPNMHKTQKSLFRDGGGCSAGHECFVGQGGAEVAYVGTAKSQGRL